MEYEVGEIFELNGKYYQVIEDDEYDCKNCSFDRSTCWQFDLDSCTSQYREDKKNVNFILAEDLGEIYKMFEELQLIVLEIEEANQERDYVWMKYYNQVDKIKKFIVNNYGYGRKN